jgi:hypothetical protein
MLAVLASGQLVWQKHGKAFGRRGYGERSHGWTVPPAVAAATLPPSGSEPLDDRVFSYLGLPPAISRPLYLIMGTHAHFACRISLGAIRLQILTKVDSALP